MNHIQIAIDGPSGAGKSTVAKAVAEELGILHLDTGAMYRALAYYAINKGVDPRDRQGCEALLGGVNIEVDYIEGKQLTKANGEDVSHLIRTEEVGKGASAISAHLAVREKLVSTQQSIGKSMSVVMDGRDIGAVVLPHTPNKFYITASAQARANRRYLELKNKGEDVNEAEVLKDIMARDYDDSHRIHSPLTKVDDALELDTTDLTIDEAKRAVLSHIRSNMEK